MLYKVKTKIGFWEDEFKFEAIDEVDAVRKAKNKAAIRHHSYTSAVIVVSVEPVANTILNDAIEQGGL